jgi:hypothetical protein
MSAAGIGPMDAAQAAARLLEAEGAARVTVQRCEADAAREVEAAREAARQHLERAERRIERAARGALERLERSVAELRATARALDTSSAAGDPREARLGEAVERLAAQLTTQADGAAG